MFVKGLSHLLKVQIKQRQGQKHLADYLKSNQTWFKLMQSKLKAETTRPELLKLWTDEIAPHIKQGVWTVLGTVTKSADFTILSGDIHDPLPRDSG